MNTETELRQAIGKTLIGAGVVQDKGLLMLFFSGCTIAVRVEGGALIWETYEDTAH